MFLGLGLCVFVLTLGVGALMFATIKRHQLLIESVLYSSIGSLRRTTDKMYVEQKERNPRKQSEVESQVVAKFQKNEDYTDKLSSTSKVELVPKYSVVNKPKRDVQSQLLNEKKAIEQNEITHAKIKPERNPITQETQSKSVSTSIYEIFSTLQFRSKRKPVKENIQKKETHKPGGSFYYQTSSCGSSSKYDLTMGKNITQVQAQVHQEASIYYENTFPKQTGQAETIYSFKTLQKRCRELIAGSKPFQDSPK